MNEMTNTNDTNDTNDIGAINVGAVLDENNQCIDWDEFPLDGDTFIALLEAASAAGEIFELDNAAEIFGNDISELELYAFKHDGKTIVFNYGTVDGVPEDGDTVDCDTLIALFEDAL